MKRYLGDIQIRLDRLIGSLNTAEDLRIVARELAMAEMKLQACRSLLEARLFEDEIENMKEEAIVK